MYIQEKSHLKDLRTKTYTSWNVSVSEFRRSIRFKSVFKRKTTDVCKYWNAYV